MNGMSRLLCGTALACVVMNGQAHAQVASAEPQEEASAIAQPTAVEGDPAAAEEAADGGDIIVTGTRISRPGLTSPTPVTALSSEQLTLAAPTTIASGINQLPQFRNSSKSEAATTSAAGAVGGAQLNLRNLGVNRTLVLLDGQRVVPSSNVFAVNIDALPEPLIADVQVVTGGASAAYGSDAVAGVVNFIVDNRFDGIKGTLQGSISDIGDAEGLKGSLAFGTDLGENLRFVASIDVFYREGLGRAEQDRRGWSARSPGLLPNVPANATPNNFVITDGFNSSVATYGGLISSGPLRGTAFGPGGQTVPFSYGELVGAASMRGGIGASPVAQIPMTNTLKRGTAFGRLIYEVPEGPTIAVDASYGRAINIQDGAISTFRTTTAFTIFSDNPYLPSDVVTRMQQAGVTSFQLGRQMRDHDTTYKNTVDYYRAAIKVNGDLGDSGWKYDAYYTHGQTTTLTEWRGVYNLNRVFAAVDAVRDPATGRIVCRSTLLFGRNPDCVPLNLFGEFSRTDEADAWVSSPNFSRRTKIKQDAGAFNVQGPLFSLWADPVFLAAGIEFRRESMISTVSDGLLDVVDFTGVRGGPASYSGQVGPYFVGNPKPIPKSSVGVKEAYLEVDAPIVQDQPFADLLSLNGAVRITDYTLSGAVTTWKLGATYKPFEDLRLRITRSRDIRAANLVEQFTGPTQTTTQVRNPATQVLTQSVNTPVGNPDLDPERADTLTFGGVYTPGWLPGFNFSVDYYRINIKGAVSTLTPQQTVDQCAEGSAVACANVVFTPSPGTPGSYRIRLPFLNLNSLKTSGLDFELGYTTSLGDGRLSLRAFANYQGKFQSQSPGAAPIDLAGDVGSVQFTASNKWMGSASATYAQGRFTGFLQARYIGAGKFNALWTEGVQIDDNSVPAIVYFDTTLAYKLGPNGGENVEAFLTVNNLFNKDPALVPIQIGSSTYNTNTTVYDAVGRYFTLGVRFKF